MIQQKGLPKDEPPKMETFLGSHKWDKPPDPTILFQNQVTLWGLWTPCSLDNSPPAPGLAGPMSAPPVHWLGPKTRANTPAKRLKRLNQAQRSARRKECTKYKTSLPIKIVRCTTFLRNNALKQVLTVPRLISRLRTAPLTPVMPMSDGHCKCLQ